MQYRISQQWLSSLYYLPGPGAIVGCSDVVDEGELSMLSSGRCGPVKDKKEKFSKEGVNACVW